MASQSELCREVLSRMRDAEILDDLVLVGSWCLPAYSEYFSGVGRVRTLRTRDLDFLVPLPSKLLARVDVVEMLDDLGFIMGYRGAKGYMILEHPELSVEFLVPERGRGTDRPVDLPMLGVNAQPLRYMDVALMNVIQAELHGVEINVPHPVCFTLHRLLVAPRRREEEGRLRDREIAVHVMDLLHAKSETFSVLSFFEKFPLSWRKIIIRELKQSDRPDLIDTFGFSALKSAANPKSPILNPKTQHGL